MKLRRLWIAAALIVAAAAGAAAWGWHALPGWLQARLEAEGTARLGRAVKVQGVELTLRPLSLTVTGLQVAPAPGAGAGAAAGAAAGAGTAAGPAGGTGAASMPPQMALARLRVEVATESLWTLTPVIDSLLIESPRLSLARTGPGRLDIDDIVARLTGAPAAQPTGDGRRTPPPEFVLRQARITAGEFTFEDRPSGRRHALQGIDLSMPQLSSRARDADADVTAQLRLRLDGAPLAADLSARPFAAVPSARVAAKLDELPLKGPWSWLDEAGPLPLRPQGGALQAQLTVRATQPAGQAWQVTAAGQARLADVALLGPQGQPMAAWRSLEVTLDELDLAARRVTLGAVRLDQAEVDVRRDARGRIEWLDLPQPAPVADPGPSAGPEWQVRTGAIELNAARVRWQDAATRPATRLSLDPLDVQVEPLAWPLKADSPVRAKAEARLRAGTADAGRLDLAATVTPTDVGVDLQAQGLRLESAAPYLRAVLAPALRGRAALQARVEVTLPQQAADKAPGKAPGESPGKTAIRAADNWSARASVKARVASLKVQDLTLTEPGAARPALAWAELAVSDAQVDLDAQRLSVGRVHLKGPKAALQRDANGDLNATRWAAGVPVLPKPSAPGPAPTPPWRARVSDLLVESGQLDWQDAATGRAEPLALRLRGIRLAAKSLAWPLSSAEFPLELSAEMPEPASPGFGSTAATTNATTSDAATATSAAAAAAASTSASALPGRLSVAGRASPQPAAFKGRLRVERWPVHAFEAYAGPDLPVVLRSADLGLDGTADVRMTPQGLRLQAQADVAVADFRLQTRREAGPGDDLATWNLLSLKPVKVALQPGERPRVEVGEIRLDDFFARLQITEQGRLNFQNPDAQPAPSGPATAAAQAAPAAPPVDTPASSGSTSRWPLDLVVGSTVLSNGRVDFNDRFIRPNYSADLSELNGTLGRFESGSTAMAPLELRGRAARTALLEIRGAVNPAITPLALDLSARATDLELAPLSPYSGKYAGYLIERGKLSVDLAYRIDPDGKLEARNQIVLNQLTFGDKVDSPSATSLPVRFAVALLSDRNGVIDINLPISGSINDPQFSLFGIVLKVIGNLIVKAVTAPFSLFSGGGGPEQSTVEFEPGTARIAQSSLETLERVAKALGDRPALRMTVAGTADPVLEREAMRSAALEERLDQARRRDAARAATGAAASTAVTTAPSVSPSAAPAGASTGANGTASGTTGTPSTASAPAEPPLTPAQRTALLKRLYIDTSLPDKPRNLIGQLRDLPAPEMESRLLAAVVVSTDTARALALQRGLAVRDALIARGLPAERLFLGAPLVRAAGEDETGWKPRVQLTLSGP